MNEVFQHAVEGPASRLVVILHGFRSSVLRMQGVIDAAHAAYLDADVYMPVLPYGGNRTPLFIADPAEIAGEMVDRISELVTAMPGGYADIIIVGYSSGSLIARKIVILAQGQLDATFEPQVARFANSVQPWADRISRVVLLAGLSRGWTVNSALTWLDTVKWSVGAFLGETIGRGRSFLLALRSGSPFMIHTRLQWLALGRLAKRPMIVQLLGTVDDLVSPEDNIDLFIDRPSADNFLLIEVAGTGHMTIIDMAPLDPARDVRGLRWSIFCHALASSAEALEPLAIPRAHLADSLPEEPDSSVTDVVFVIHGIRDKGFWTQKIAREIKRVSLGKSMEDGRPRNVQSMTASYGYFPMFPFVLPWLRAHKVAWLMDRYAEAKARFPEARFSYVGHSNGTYLIAGALRDYVTTSFERVVLAGSVIRTDFDWSAYLSAGRVRSLLNYVATSDIVVAGVPKGFQRLNLFDLGSGGHDGFDVFGPVRRKKALAMAGCARLEFTSAAGVPSYQIEFVQGGHGAGVKETQWDDIAAFIVDGTPPDEGNRDFGAGRPTWLARAASVQPLPLLVLIGVVAAIVTGLWLLFWPLGIGAIILLFIILTKI